MNPPSNPGIPLPTAGAASGPARAGRQTQQPLPGRAHSNSQPPPMGAAGGPGSGLHDTTRPPPLGPPPPSQPIPLIPSVGSSAGGPVPGRSHSATQPPSLRSHSATQPPAMRGHDTTRPPPLGPPPPSQTYTPVQSMPPIMAAPPMTGPIVAPMSGPPGPPPSQPYTPVESMPPIMATPPMTTVPMNQPPGAASTQLGIPAAPTGMGWGPGPGGPSEQAQGFGFGGPAGAPGAAGAMAASGLSAASLATALRRAFRLRIDPALDPSGAAADLSPAEASALDVAGVLDPYHRAFLAWRRSVLLVVAVALVPLTVLRLIHVLDAGGLPGILRVLQLVPVLVEGAFAGLLFLQLGHWTRWQTQRRTVMLGFAATFLAPFVVFLYPIDGAGSGGLNLAYALYTVLVLGPKALALMPGVTRAAIVAKLLFPGNAAPGWLVVLAAPLAALLAYVMLVVPYQLTGSGYFVLAIAGLAGAQLLLARAGFRLARPSSQVDALSLVTRARPGYLLALAFGGLFAIVAISRLQMGGLVLTSAVLGLGVNLLVLTLVGADLLIANMERARNVSVDAQAAIAESQQRLTTFARESTPGTNVLR